MTGTVQRQNDAANQIWFEKTGSKTSIGFTEPFLETVRDCWHVLPAVNGKVKEKAPLFAIETNDALMTIFSPATGSIVSFSNTAQNFPDKLTQDEVVCVIDEVAPVKPADDGIAELRQRLAEIQRRENVAVAIPRGLRGNNVPVPPRNWGAVAADMVEQAQAQAVARDPGAGARFMPRGWDAGVAPQQVMADPVQVIFDEVEDNEDEF